MAGRWWRWAGEAGALCVGRIEAGSGVEGLRGGEGGV
jgi:hypothetical protein